MIAPALRPLLSTAVTALAVGSLALTSAPAAFAAPGDNGDVKIHLSGTAVGSLSDETKVCRFYLDAFNFDTLALVDWEISPQPAKSATPSLSGSINLSVGIGHTNDLMLPNGTYQLTWKFLGETGVAKHKVFTVDCTGNHPGGGRPPHGPVGAGGGGSAEMVAASADGTAFGVGSAVVAALAGTAGLILVRRSRRRSDGVA
ncbi:hypothetical protein AB0C52_23290 [Streptomyces sp. NPDC048717]|uniref:hypothetical protein n=1 Tax=unclassified Streptomyces TaxID=2593676 RepID=UPI003439DFEA